MRTTISAAALLLAIGLAGPAFAQATEGGKQPAKEGVQAGQEPSEAKDIAKPGSGTARGQATGTPDAQAPEGGKQPAKEGVQAGQEPPEAKDKTK